MGINKLSYIKKCRYVLHFNTSFLILLTLIKSFKAYLINMTTIFMISAEMTTAALLKVKVFWNKGYDITISVHNVIKKILLRDSNVIVDVFMRLKFGNSRISMREVIISSSLQGLDQKNCFFEAWSWFKFNNFGLALGRNLKFYSRVAKWLKSKDRKICGLVPKFVGVTGEKLLEWDFFYSSPPPFPILNRVKAGHKTI